jgi:hypothetical protein
VRQVKVPKDAKVLELFFVPPINQFLLHIEFSGDIEGPQGNILKFEDELIAVEISQMSVNLQEVSVGWERTFLTSEMLVTPQGIVPLAIYIHRKKSYLVGVN